MKWRKEGDREGGSGSDKSQPEVYSRMRYRSPISVVVNSGAVSFTTSLHRTYLANI